MEVLMSNALLTVRTDEKLKRSVGEKLKRLGLNHSTAINIFYHAIDECDGLPFPVRIPSKDTLEAMRELERGEGAVYATPKDLFEGFGLSKMS